MKITQSSTPNKWVGGNTCKEIIIHWWDDPVKRPTLQGVVGMFQNPAYEVSAHYVVSGDDVVKMCNETDRPWHAVAANGFGIGIEVDPNTPGNTYKTLGELVRDIRSRRGNIPLKRHSDYVNTRCPGNIDFNRIENEAKGASMQAPISEGGDYNAIAPREFIDTFIRTLLGRDPKPGELDERISYGRLFDKGMKESRGLVLFTQGQVKELSVSRDKIFKQLEDLRKDGHIDEKAQKLIDALKEALK